MRERGEEDERKGRKVRKREIKETERYSAERERAWKVERWRKREKERERGNFLRILVLIRWTKNTLSKLYTAPKNLW